MDPRNSEVSGVILSIILPVSSLNISCGSSNDYISNVSDYNRGIITSVSSSSGNNGSGWSSSDNH